jgi:uncharacterized protein (TIGR02271 family)
MAHTQGTPIEGLTEEQVPDLRNIPVYSNGEEIGHVGDVYYDDDRGTVECVGIKGDALGFKRQWVPVQGAMLHEDGLHLNYPREQFEGAPHWDDDTELDAGRYAEVRQHFVRHEEELQVGKQQTETGTVRLRKWVETEAVAVDVELQRETAQVVREQLSEPVAGDVDAFREQEIDVALHAERPVVSKQTVAKERVGLEKDVETTTQTVQEEVRKERVGLEGDGEVERR